MPAPIEFKDLLRAKLPFWPTLNRAYALTFANFSSLIKLSWKWLLLLVPFQLLFFWHATPYFSTLYNQMGTPEVSPLPPWIALGSVVLGVITYVVYSAPAVGWHRLILRNVAPSGVMEVDGATSRYAGYVLLLYGLFNIPVLAMHLATPQPGVTPGAFQLIVIIVSTVLMYVAIALLFRLMVFLPGVAVYDPEASLNTVWEKSRGHTFRLLFGNILAALPFTLLAGGLSYLLMSRFDALTATLLHPLTTFLGFIGVAIGLAFTSLAYRFLYLEDHGAPRGH